MNLQEYARDAKSVRIKSVEAIDDGPGKHRCAVSSGGHIDGKQMATQ